MLVLESSEEEGPIAFRILLHGGRMRVIQEASIPGRTWV